MFTCFKFFTTLIHLEAVILLSMSDLPITKKIHQENNKIQIKLWTKEIHMKKCHLIVILKEEQKSLILPMPWFGRTVIRKQTSCFLKFSHSCLISFRTLNVTVTSARTRDGAFSPMLGLATSTTAKLVMGWAIRAQPPKYTLSSSERLVMKRSTYTKIFSVKIPLNCI